MLRPREPAVGGHSPPYFTRGLRELRLAPHIARFDPPPSDRYNDFSSSLAETGKPHMARLTCALLTTILLTHVAGAMPLRAADDAAGELRMIEALITHLEGLQGAV